MLGGGNSVWSGVGDDAILVSADGNTIQAGAGCDAIGLGGNDNSAWAGTGDDAIIVAGNGNTIRGGAGQDLVRIEGQRNTVSAGPDADAILVEGKQARADNTVHGGGGNDTFRVNGWLTTAHGGLGDDEFVLGVDGLFSTLHGGAGDDRFTLDVPLLFVPPDAGVLPPDRLAEVMQLFATRSLVQAFGGAGNDVFSGGLFGTTLRGGPGDDLFDLARALSTTIHGGAGDDVFRLAEGTSVGLYGGTGNDEFDVTAAQTLLFGGPGDDVITLRGSGSVAYGGNGADRLVVEGGGTNLLVGGLGQDEMTDLSAGRTTYFVFESIGDSRADPATADVVRGFTPRQDTLFLGGVAVEAGLVLDPNTQAGGLVFSGVGPLQVIVGEVAVAMLNATDTWVMIDVDGDGEADSGIILADVEAGALSQSDFFLLGAPLATLLQTSSTPIG